MRRLAFRLRVRLIGFKVIAFMIDLSLVWILNTDIVRDDLRINIHIYVLH